MDSAPVAKPELTPTELNVVTVVWPGASRPGGVAPDTHQVATRAGTTPRYVQNILSKAVRLGVYRRDPETDNLIASTPHVLAGHKGREGLKEVDLNMVCGISTDPAMDSNAGNREKLPTLEPAEVNLKDLTAIEIVRMEVKRLKEIRLRAQEDQARAEQAEKEANRRIESLEAALEQMVEPFDY